MASADAPTSNDHAAFKPELQAQSQTPDIDESFALGEAAQAPQKDFDDGRLECVHALRGQVTEIDHAGIK